MHKMIQSAEMPAPETLVAYHDGVVGAAMFHYAAEGSDHAAIAREHSFEHRELWLEHDAEADEALTKAYEDGASDICARWHPSVPEGWLLGAKHDTEDGPIAVFIRKRELAGS